MKKTILPLLLLTFIFSLDSFAQQNYNIIQFKDETIKFVQQPLSWDSNDWLKLGLIGAGSFLVIQGDQSIREFFQKDTRYANSSLMEFGKMYGTLFSPALIAGAFELHHLISDNESSKKIAFEIVQATLYTGAITAMLKVSIGRARPFTEEGSKSFLNWKLLNDSYYSFPSNHTATAFAVSTVLSKNAKTDFLKIAAYAPALITAVSRVYQDQHWASDVLVGGILGYVVADWVTSEHKIDVSFHPLSTRQLTFSVPLK